MIKNKNKGIATLPTVIILSIMVLAVVVSITSVSMNEIVISQSQKESQNALFFAESGARDALTRIARDKTYSCTSTDCYLLDFTSNGCSTGGGCAKISVSSGVGTTADHKIITSKGLSGSSIRIMRVEVELDNGTSDDANQKGEITSAIWTEVIN